MASASGVHRYTEADESGDVFMAPAAPGGGRHTREHSGRVQVLGGDVQRLEMLLKYEELARADAEEKYTQTQRAMSLRLADVEYEFRRAECAKDIMELEKLELRKQIVCLDHTYADTRERLAVLEEQVAQHESAKATLRENADNAEFDVASLEAARSEVVELKKQLEDEKQNRKHLQKRIRELSTHNDSHSDDTAMAQLEEYRAREAALHAKCDKQLHEIEQLRVQLSRVDQKSSSARPGKKTSKTTKAACSLVDSDEEDEAAEETVVFSSPERKKPAAKSNARRTKRPREDDVEESTVSQTAAQENRVSPPAVKVAKTTSSAATDIRRKLFSGPAPALPVAPPKPSVMSLGKSSGKSIFGGSLLSALNSLEKNFAVPKLKQPLR